MVGVQRPDLAGRLEGLNAYRKQLSGGVVFKDGAYRPRVSDSENDHGLEKHLKPSCNQYRLGTSND